MIVNGIISKGNLLQILRFAKFLIKLKVINTRKKVDVDKTFFCAKNDLNSRKSAVKAN